MSTIPPATSGITVLDWAVILAYAAGMLGIGWYFSRRNASSEDYLLGNRDMKSSSIGLSLFATLFSTITYLALPGELINKGPVILCWIFGMPLVYGVVGYVLIPPFMKVRVTSAYEILEQRLGLSVRLVGSCIFLATRLLWMALITYITAEKLIVTVMGWDPSWTLYVAASIGLVTVIYTSMGGIRAVVLTDVIQSFILFGAALAAIALITIKMGGFSAWWPTEWSPTWESQPFISFDPRVRVTMVGSFVFMTLWWICTAGSDQMAVQRYLATRDVKAARKAFLMTVVSNVFVNTILGALGLALLGFFRANPPTGLSVERDGDKLFPYYIVHHLPAGATGLVIAGLLAAAMSSLSGGINSACSVIATDFLDRFRATKLSQNRQLTRERLISVIVGVLMVGLSLAMGRVTGNIMEVTVRTNHVFVAPLFGLFFMAMFVPFSTPIGAGSGAIAGCIAGVLIAYWDLLTELLTGERGPTLSFQWITLVSLIAHLVVGCAVSLLTGGGKSRGLREPGSQPAGANAT